MATITFDHATRQYPGATRPAVDALDLDIADGEFLVLVGPSGCGKSTSLRMLAGLEEVNSGAIRIGDRDVTHIPPKDRDIAMVFQNYALYPHMSVFDNMAFGLKLQKMPKTEIDERVRHAAGILGLEDLLARKPKALSGGQRQRVAIARVFLRNPAVDKLDLSIGDGEFLVLVGPSGCGKSTSLRMLAGLEDVDNGSSMQNTWGLRTIARPIATRCR